MERLSERLNSLHAELRNLGELVSVNCPHRSSEAVASAAEAADYAARTIREAKHELAKLLVGSA
jgi:cell division protein ZapA (FtsZ GTPase activity inhibitor)